MAESSEIRTPWGRMSIRAAAERAGVSPQTLWWRYKRGYTSKHLFAPVTRNPDGLTDAQLIRELRARGYKIILKTLDDAAERLRKRGYKVMSKKSR